MTTQFPPYRIALTPGEPAGIGPDICLQLARQAHRHELVAVADRGLLAARAEQLGLRIDLPDYDPDARPHPHRAGHLPLLHVPVANAVASGRLDPGNSPYVVECLSQAHRGCIDGRFAALVTAPVHKGVINQAGIAFTGHTEYLQAQSGAATVVMMLATTGLRVALVTTHLPLKDVPAAIDRDRLARVLRITHDGLVRDFGIEAPRILVCGLNPHAGEDGHLGREEIDTIIPVIRTLTRDGLRLTGPLPADSLFIPKYLDDTDAVVAMYHDQGLPVLKHMGFGDAVNITLGLPYVRTSVDHGTALELAGSGRASAQSLAIAVTTAIGMVEQRHRHAPPPTPGGATPA